MTCENTDFAPNATMKSRSPHCQFVGDDLVGLKESNIFKVESNGGTWFNRQKNLGVLKQPGFLVAILDGSRFFLTGINWIVEMNITFYWSTLPATRSNTFSRVLCLQTSSVRNMLCLFMFTQCIHVSTVNDSKFGHQKYCHNCSYGKDCKNQLAGQK